MILLQSVKVTTMEVCPLWVISGHIRLREKASALPPKADILFGGEKSPLSAKNRHDYFSRKKGVRANEEAALSAKLL
jgi:hypothetical protein